MNQRRRAPRLDRFRAGREDETRSPEPGRGVAVTQIRLSRAQVDLLTRMSAATRLRSNDRYLMRIDILRLFVDELIRAELEPARIASVRALETLLASHFRAARVQAGHPVALLAGCLEDESPSVSGRPVLDFARLRQPAAWPPSAFESFTLRLSTADIVAIDTFRCDIRERCGFILSRSGLLRALLDAFVEAVRPARPSPRNGARPEGRMASSPR